MSRAAVRQATPAWVNWDALNAIHHTAPAGWHVDHIIPLKGVTADGWPVSGLNVPWNLQYLPAAENRRKGRRAAPAIGGQGTPEWIAMCEALFLHGWRWNAEGAGNGWVLRAVPAHTWAL